jgi:hypothetical protein
VVPESLSQFFVNADRTWRELTGPGYTSTFDTNVFLHRAARLFKQEGQEEQNALEVLQAILAPKKLPVTTFDQFARFLAMFGPNGTVMLKIASLLGCSHRTGQWLYFDVDTVQLPTIAGTFDVYEPNCLVIRNNGNVTKVWNAPLVEANNKAGYIIDQLGHTYRSWAEYFERHPVTAVSCEMVYPY